jgi:hypothetical protein
MKVIVEKLEECELVEETEVIEKKPAQCHSLHHKSHMT